MARNAAFFRPCQKRPDKQGSAWRSKRRPSAKTPQKSSASALAPRFDSARSRSPFRRVFRLSRTRPATAQMFPPRFLRPRYTGLRRDSEPIAADLPKLHPGIVSRIDKRPRWCCSKFGRKSVHRTLETTETLVRIWQHSSNQNFSVWQRTKH